jgi:membrane-bound ClpP family serine protease
MYLYSKALYKKSPFCKSVLIMDWLPIVIFVFLGIALLIIEIIFVPGTTVVGILGFLSMVYGIYLSYSVYGNTVGTLTMVGALLVSGLFIFWSFRNRSWERFSLKTTMQGKVNEDFSFPLSIGMKGITISSLKPIGKASFDDHEMEVRSNGEFVEENVQIEVVRIDGQKVFVKPLNK